MTATPERLATLLADRYRIDRKLGEGGMASVYLGDAPIQGMPTPTASNGSGWGHSEDGRHFVVTKPVDRPDVFLLRNFGELLRR